MQITLMRELICIVCKLGVSRFKCDFLKIWFRQHSLAVPEDILVLNGYGTCLKIWVCSNIHRKPLVTEPFFLFLSFFLFALKSAIFKFFFPEIL